MSYAAIHASIPNQTGAPADQVTLSPVGAIGPNIWHDLWTEMFRTQAIKTLPRTTATVAICFAMDVLPIAESILATTTKAMLDLVESIFGASVSDTAKILRVSRPMVYHYREGVEPSVENKRRLQTLAALASDFDSPEHPPLKPYLKVKQPEGRSLIEYLSDQDLDVAGLRRVIQRNLAANDKKLRARLGVELTRRETLAARRDIIDERHAEGKPVYVGDPDAPGKLIQILPGGKRVRGTMVKRRFTPD